MTDLTLPPQAAVPSVAVYFDASPVPAFAIDTRHIVTQWNKACERLTGLTAADMVGTNAHWKVAYKEPRPLLVDLVVDAAPDSAFNEFYDEKSRRSALIPGGYEAEDFFPDLGAEGKWLSFSASPLHDSEGRLVGAIEVLRDVTQRKVAESALHNVQMQLEDLVAQRTAQLEQANARLEEDIRRREAAEAELLRRNAELTKLNSMLSHTQEQLLQSEKMASIGQLAAGVAHEINNPIGYIFSNVGSLEGYIGKLFEMLAIYEEAEQHIASPEALAKVKAAREQLELDYLREDIPALMNESKEGIVRVRKIVQDLKDFSRVDMDLEWQWANLHRGIDSTLNIVNNEVKYKADVVRNYGEIPDIECLPSQINQVVMNLVVNAAHAIGPERGKITISTGADVDHVWITVADTGCGIPKENLQRIFDPFFTTKPIGSGTGLGLSLSYGIVQKHNGSIEVESEPGKGTTFRVTLPVRHDGTPPTSEKRT